MELNSNSIHVGCITFCGRDSNINDPSVTLLMARLPHLTPRREKELIEVVSPVIIGMVKQFEQALKEKK